MAIGLCLVPIARAAVQASYSLGPPTIQGNSLRYPLSLNYTADAGERVAYFAVDVSASAAVFTGSGADYSAFSFSLAAGLGVDWNPIPFGVFGPSPFQDTAEYETANAYLVPGIHALGTLSVDLELLGLPVSTAYSVSVVGPNSVVGAEVPGQSGTFKFDPVEAANIPEPSSWAGIAGCGCLLAAVLRRRGRD